MEAPLSLAPFIFPPTYPHSLYCSLSSNMHGFFPSSKKKKKKHFFFNSETSSQDCFIYFLYFLPDFSDLWSAPTSSISWPLTCSLFTSRMASINIVLLKMCSQGHQWPSHLPMRSVSSPSPHSPLLFNNLCHQSPCPMFLLGNTYVYSSLSIPNGRTLGWCEE